ncbi:BRO-N domain-containing protein [Nostoc sp.]|uniref:BRO-N domain-containing protein n=1 Tax=Nostoc sp. TaxID=1180 RepID=UPI002FF61F1E
MSNLSVFNFESHDIRFVGTAESPLWVVVDICKVLEILNPSMAIEKLDDDERAKFNLGRQGETWCVNESGLYSLVLTSRKPQAKRFKKWLTSEVIPAIRKTGTYSTKPATSLTLIDTSKLDALNAKASKLQEEVRTLETRLASIRNELQNIRMEEVAIAKALITSHPDVVKHAIKCNEILEAYGDGNKYFSNPLKK